MNCLKKGDQKYISWEDNGKQYISDGISVIADADIQEGIEYTDELEKQSRYDYIRETEWQIISRYSW